MQKGLWFLLEVVLSMSKDASPILLHCKVNWSIVMHLQGHRLVRLSPPGCSVLGNAEQHSLS